MSAYLTNAEAVALDDFIAPDRSALMTVRRVLVWVAANVALVLALGVGFVAWAVFTGPSSEFSGPGASGRGGLIAVGRGMPLVLLGALVVLNLAWIAFVVRKR